MINSRRSSFKQPCYRKWRASADRLYGDQPDVWAALWVTQETGTGTFKKITSMALLDISGGTLSTAALAAHHATLSGSMSNFPRVIAVGNLRTIRLAIVRQLIRIAMFSRKKLFGAATVSLKGMLARVWLSNGLITNKTGKELTR